MSYDKGFTNDAIPALSVCESPIEGKFVQAFFDTFYHQAFGFKYESSDEYRLLVRFESKEPRYCVYLLGIQASPAFLSGARVDFSVTIFVPNRLKSTIAAFVELDGAAFHASDEQRDRDRRKDRVAARNGGIVLRFSGSEVYKDPMGVVKEVLETLDERCASQMKRELEIFNLGASKSEETT